MSILEQPLDLVGLRSMLTGAVIGPDDSDYDAARTVWNADVDRRPAVVARCLGPSDVQAAIAFARAQGLEIAVRGGAHSMSGACMVDDGVVIDLSRLNDVTVDLVARRVRAGGGALLGDVDAATQVHGLAVPAGVVSDTGVAGLTLGGGMGWLTRQGGLTIDNLVSAEVVTADGRILRAAEDENPDLFWALRGGGGNFGVVTEFEFRLHEVGPMVQLGMLFWELDRGPEVLRLARDVVATLPDDCNLIIAGLTAPPAPFVPEEHHFAPGYALLVVGFGDQRSHAAVLEQTRGALTPLFEFATPMPFVDLQKMLDDGNQWGQYCYDKGCYLEELSDGAIEVITGQLPQRTSPLSTLLIYVLDGAYSEVGDDETAFSGGRSPRLAVFMVGIGSTRGELAPERAWVRDFWEALRPHTPDIGSYVNAMTEPEQDRLRAAYGPAKYERLARIKRRYDPENVFHLNANIPPA